MLNGRLEVLTLPELDGKIAMVGVQKAGRNNGDGTNCAGRSQGEGGVGAAHGLRVGSTVLRRCTELGKLTLRGDKVMIGKSS